MKKMIASLAAVALFAAPALAEPTNKIVIPKGSYSISPADVQEGTRGINNDGIYNNLQSGNPQTQYLLNNQTAFVGDDLHMIAPGSVMTTFRWVYSDNGNTANGGGVSHTSTLLFSNNTAGDNSAVNSFALTTGVSSFTAAFLITGLPNATVNNPNGGWLITVGLPGIQTGPDIWVGLLSGSTTVGNVGLRGTSLSPTVGSSHNLHYATTGFTSTSFFTVANGGTFRMAVLPEPAVAGLLALGGLVMLRRRARA
jgi:hypothetical protein